MAKAIFAVREEFSVEIADTPSNLQEVFRLRHQVYCVERQYESSATGFETDEFDDISRHVLLRSRATGEVMGTVRLVLPTFATGEWHFPMQRASRTSLRPHAPIRSTAEVSRFALSKARRDMSRASLALLRLGLVRGAVQLSNELGLTHWCAIMEPTLLRLMQTTSIYFRPIGPAVEYHGLRQPAVAEIDDTLSRMAEENPDLWDFITDGGRFWPQRARAALIA